MSHIKVKPVLLVLPVFVAAVEAFRFLEVVGQSPTAISVLKSTRGTSVTKCGIMCVQHPFCSSFGFIPGPKQCDLSSLTFEDRSDLSLFDVKQDGRAFYGSSKDALMFADVQISFQEGDVIYAEYEVTSTPPNNLNAGMEILSGGSLDSKFAHSGGMVFDPPFFRTDWLFPNPTNFYVTATCQATGFLFEIKDSAQTLVYTHTTGHRVAGATCATIEGVQFTNGKADHLFCRTLKILRP
ncbi:unnamed protein product [Cyprideis torosa]|uniref:Apple domain-containing protein n=1 Tax=Cyprideis torosa TaxID=163714 RepID=A0A7R8ZMN9_9CRUS|nr:unnamed protein product [Cyprideis torosa]CAG0889396.1 unnamed protein product [Cyprideis torosa]